MNHYQNKCNAVSMLHEKNQRLRNLLTCKDLLSTRMLQELECIAWQARELACSTEALIFLERCTYRILLDAAYGELNEKNIMSPFLTLLKWKLMHFESKETLHPKSFKMLR